MPSVKDLMTKNVVTIDLRKTVLDAAELMNKEKRGSIVIMDGTVPIGIITERDFVRRIMVKRLPFDTAVSEIMSKPLITIDLDVSLKEAARLMLKHKIRRLPVMQMNQLVGIIVVSDFARHLGRKSITEEILEAMARYPVGMLGEAGDYAVGD